MTPDEFYSKVASPTQFVVCGLRLEPLTIGHVLRLHDLNSPYVTPGLEIGITDTLLAILTCAFPFRTSERFFQRWYFSRLVALWGWRCKRLSLVTERLKFSAYLNEAFSFPYKQGGSAGSLRSPFIYRLVTQITTTLNQSYEQALDMPILRANGLIVAHLESTGKLEFDSVEEEDRKKAFLEYCRKMDMKKFGGGA